MRITGTFLDEITHDIPSQNWGYAEWERDFQAMRQIGIDTVILIRCGHKRFVTYPSAVLAKEQGCYIPPVDLVKMYLELSERYGISFYFGTYDSGEFWHKGEYGKELELNMKIVEEVWRRYGHSPAFKGWYLSLEVSRNALSIIDMYTTLGKHCKELSSNLPVLISPYIEGKKAVYSFSAEITRNDGVSPEQHEKEWNAIMQGISGAVDLVAFQDGHVDFHELPEYLQIHKTLAEKYGLHCWTNIESFDRDMPIKFLPIKWEKMLLKLQAAEQAGIEKAITFEFPHFMSPYSCYPQAHGLFKRYREYSESL
ncbi:MAG: DUF4434 domain-containing protein [bacterium]|nr:DUF4434 domain-containing protein [bacterium]